MSQEDFDRVWKILQEVSEQQKKTERQFDKNSKAFEARSREFEVRSREFDARSKELHASIRELDVYLKESSQNFDLRIQKISETVAGISNSGSEFDQRIKKISETVGGMSNNDGAVAEEFFWNALKNRKELNGITIDYSDKNIHRKKANVEDEFDILLWNGSSVIIVETKWKVHPKDIEKLKSKKIPNFRNLFPDKTGQNIYAAIAGFSIPDEVADAAKDNGFFILRQSGDNLLVEFDQLTAY